jgi:O-antigen/teichoic acid export membrane protein
MAETKNAGFLQAVLTLMSGTTVAMGLAYAARPVLTRLFTPEAFGLLGFFMALVAVLSTASAGRYEDALMLPEDEREAGGLLILCAGITVALAALCSVFVVWREAWANLFNKPEAAPYLVWVPVSVFALGVIRWGGAWLNRGKHFRALSTGKVAQSAIEVPVQLGTGWSDIGTGGLIAGRVAGQAASALVYLVAVLRGHRRLIRSAWDRALIRRMAGRYRDFPRFGVPAALMNTAAAQLPIFLLIFFFEPAVAGFYTQSYGLLAVPINLIGGSVGQVFFVHAADAHREGALAQVTEAVFLQMVRIGLFPLLALVIVGPDVLQFVLGEGWREAGIYAQWLGVWLFFVFVSSPLTFLLDVLEKQRANLVYNVIVFVVRTIALLIGGFLGRPILAVALFGVSGSLIRPVYTFWLLNMGGVPIRTGLRILQRYALLALVPLVILGLVQVSNVLPGWTTLAAVVCGLVYFGLTMWGE